MDAPLLQITDLAVEFRTPEGQAKVLDGVSLSLSRGETLGIVGESGCGKSVTGQSIMRLIPDSLGKVTGGDILLEGESLIAASPAQLRGLRGGRMAMIFQDPMVSLNPVMRVGDQIAESIVLHQKGGLLATWDRVVAALGSVQIADPARRAKDWPHQFSGGMRQRGMIAMMLACRPALLIADEPTTALDVTVQAQVLLLIRDLQRELGMGVVLITHNLGVVAEVCDRVAVMYAGTVVETASVIDLFANPRHPYTRALLAAIPRADQDCDSLSVIEGTVPNLVTPPSGCRFHPRCPQALAICRTVRPATVTVAPDHAVACHLHPGAA
jgi:peptide/nickel transport system ATP-binding protein